MDDKVSINKRGMMTTGMKKENHWKLLMMSVAICLAFWTLAMPEPATAGGGGGSSNTYRHIYNQSRCSIHMWVDASSGNMYCNGGKNSFTIAPNSSPEYELTTSGGVSAGKIHVTHVAHGDMVLDYRFTGSCAVSFCWFRSSRGGDWGALNVNDCGSIGWKINSPAKGDITFCNDTCP